MTMDVIKLIVVLKIGVPLPIVILNKVAMSIVKTMITICASYYGNCDQGDDCYDNYCDY